jgi:hypothetical protein
MTERLRKVRQALIGPAGPKKGPTATCTVFKDFNASLNLRVWEPQRENLSYSANISVFKQTTCFLTLQYSSSIRYLRYIDADQVSNLHNSSSLDVRPTTAYGTIRQLDVIKISYQPKGFRFRDNCRLWKWVCYDLFNPMRR